MYKEALKLNLRFQTSVGLLTVEQLFGLSLLQLENAVKSVAKALKKGEKDESLNFLEDQNVSDKENELRFAILKDIYIDKKKENADALQLVKNKEHNAKIDALIARKKDEELESMSVEDLEKLRK